MSGCKQIAIRQERETEKEGNRQNRQGLFHCTLKDINNPLTLSTMCKQRRVSVRPRVDCFTAFRNERADA